MFVVGEAFSISRNLAHTVVSGNFLASAHGVVGYLQPLPVVTVRRGHFMNSVFVNPLSPSVIRVNTRSNYN